eukprot:UN12185
MTTFESDLSEDESSVGNGMLSRAYDHQDRVIYMQNKRIA